MATSNTSMLQPYQLLKTTSETKACDLIDLCSPENNRDAKDTTTYMSDRWDVQATQNIASPTPASKRHSSNEWRQADNMQVVIGRSPMASAGYQDNTAVVITGLPADTTYHTLLLYISSIRPGRIRTVKIGRIFGTTRSAGIAFFTHAAALRVRTWRMANNTRPMKSYINGEVVYPSISWHDRYVAPSEPNGCSRIIMVRGSLAVVTVDNVAWASRRAGFNPEVEDVIFKYSQFQGFVTLQCRFRSVRDAGKAKGILEASLPCVTIQYLPDTCE